MIVLLAGAYHATTPEERMRYREQYVFPAAEYGDKVLAACAPFREAASARTPRIVAAPVLAALPLLLFLLMVFGSGSLDDPGTLLNWGANQRPRTANGEWWRLITATFVHAGPFHLLFSL